MNQVSVQTPNLQINNANQTTQNQMMNYQMNTNNFEQTIKNKMPDFNNPKHEINSAYQFNYNNYMQKIPEIPNSQNKSYQNSNYKINLNTMSSRNE